MNFPTLSKGQDSKYFREVPNDPSDRKEMDGGWAITRRRFTRRPTRVFTTGFTDISNDDKGLLDAFWDAVGGGSDAFTWINPVTGEALDVRFVEKPEFVYAGMGGNHRWDVPTIKLETL